jgi:two-component system cell cycle response regulator
MPLTCKSLSLLDNGLRPDAAALSRGVQTCMDDRARAQSAPPPGRQWRTERMNDLDSSPGGRVLIVDDTPANLRLLSRILSERGYTVHAADGAAPALRLLHSEPLDAILLDVRMPGMDGYEVCEMLKRDERTRDIPVIFISAADQPEDKMKAFAAGGVDYVVKPFEAEEVLARVSTHLSLRSLQRGLEARVAERTAELLSAREALIHGQRLLQGVIDHSASLIHVKDAQGRCMLANHRFNAVFNPQAQRQVVGLTDVDIFGEAVARELRAADARVLETGGPLELEEVLEGVDGPRTYISTRTVVHGVSEQPAVCCISTDITQRVREELALRQLLEVLESRLAERMSAGAGGPTR